ncbi:hypothetical protein A5692_02330 [Mycobacterium sp. E342]|uniref:ANTAR domain-containing protein n=1 Tax=Mycobacterium sp. E342 TaxID=1834147 RepID=UPI0007FF6861|nr:ANTAR domain-containing protein [Mycobacterium sp. E342]OBH25417.1 hypothetical protein A5692_02330 [Mycobacterium sp. E342]
MTDSANHLWPGDLIAQATDIISDRCQLDGAQAFEVLRSMSRDTRMQMCVVAEQIINQNVPVNAVLRLENGGD